MWSSATLALISVCLAKAAAQEAPYSYNFPAGSAVAGIAACAQGYVIAAIAGSHCNSADRACICSNISLIHQINTIINAQCVGHDLQTSSAFFINYCPNIRISSSSSWPGSSTTSSSASSLSIVTIPPCVHSCSPTSTPTPTPPLTTAPGTGGVWPPTNCSTSIPGGYNTTGPPPVTVITTTNSLGELVTSTSTVGTGGFSATGVPPPQQTVNAAPGHGVPGWFDVRVWAVGLGMGFMGAAFAEL